MKARFLGSLERCSTEELVEIERAIARELETRSYGEAPCPGPGYHAPGDCEECDAAYEARAARQARKE